MKKYLVLCFFSFLIFQPLCAQPPHMRKRMEDRKVEIEKAKHEFITTRINLKPEQEKSFWEVYDKYTEERIILRKKIARTKRGSFSMAATDVELEKAFDDLIAFRQKEIDMDKSYKTTLLKIISIRQLSELYRSEHEFLKKVLEILRDKHPDKPKKADEED